MTELKTGSLDAGTEAQLVKHFGESFSSYYANFAKTLEFGKVLTTRELIETFGTFIAAGNDESKVLI